MIKIKIMTMTMSTKQQAGEPIKLIDRNCAVQELCSDSLISPAGNHHIDANDNRAEEGLYVDGFFSAPCFYS